MHCCFTLRDRTVNASIRALRASTNRACVLPSRKFQPSEEAGGVFRHAGWDAFPHPVWTERVILRWGKLASETKRVPLLRPEVLAFSPRRARRHAGFAFSSSSIKAFTLITDFLSSGERESTTQSAEVFEQDASTCARRVSWVCLIHPAFRNAYCQRLALRAPNLSGGWASSRGRSARRRERGMR